MWVRVVLGLSTLSVYLLVTMIFKISEACGGTWTNISGEITSPNYPSNYTDNLICIYYIATNTAVTLTIVDFAIEPGFDNLTVYDGNNHRLETFSYNTGWYVILTSTYYRLEFITDHSITDRGFNATWKVAPSALQPPTAIYTMDNCVNAGFYITTTHGLTLRVAERFITTSIMECLLLCMQNEKCTAFNTAVEVCAHYENGIGGNYIGSEIWKRS